MAKAPGRLVLHPEYAREEAVRGIEGFSHIWLLFLFNSRKSAGRSENPDTPQNWSPMVRPPRLGGNKKVGVFASRSPFRPNPIGMSVVRLKKIDLTSEEPVMHVTGADILDQTPILDIKPYLPYSDIIPDAKDGFAKGPPPVKYQVTFSDNAQKKMVEKERQLPDLLEIITKILENDPRPAYHDNPGSTGTHGRLFGIRIFDFDLKWTIKENFIHVLDLVDEAQEKI